MKIYFYHTRESKNSLEEWRSFHFPGHLMYGLPLLDKYNIDSILHRHRYIENRLLLMLYVTKEILFCKKKYDVLYGTSFRGLEFIIFLHALGLYRRPIVVWHHTALRRSNNKIKEMFSCLFYKGIDKMFFFSQRHIDISKSLNKVPPSKLQLIHWGPDLAFYDAVLKKYPIKNRLGFISTGKENRDLETLIRAFKSTNEFLNIYISESCGSLNYKQILQQLSVSENIEVHYSQGVIPYELACEVAKKQFVVISCFDYPYTVGLTTLVEALALGIPVLCSRNPYFEIDIDKEEIGITIPYGDIQGWKNAIEFMISNPEEVRKMGQNARSLAERKFNLDLFAKEVAEALLEFNN